jgi:hypothetical protein
MMKNCVTRLRKTQNIIPRGGGGGGATDTEETVLQRQLCHFVFCSHFLIFAQSFRFHGNQL